MYLLLQGGVTALHRAADNGHPDTCEVLLKNNANVNAEAEVSIFKFSGIFGCFLFFSFLFFFE